jgi:MFS family permease
MRSSNAPGTRPYYGWYVLLVAAAAMVGTLPGRTQGLGLVTEPLLADLALDRVTYATLNFWATILGAGAAVGMGHAIDRWGTRGVLTIVTLALGAVVCAMSQTKGTSSLAVYLTLTRALGQSALSVVSLAIVGHWFVRRIDTATATYSIVLSIGFMIAFPVVGAIVQSHGWRVAWLSVGCSLLVILTPLAWFVVRRNPESCGLAPDGMPGLERPATPAPAESAVTGHSWAWAIFTPAFWVFAAGTALYGLVASGIGLFNESILAERGFGPDVYYRTLVITALVALAGNFLGGWLARRVSLTLLLSVSLLILAAGVAALPHVSEQWHVGLWAAAMGLGGGLVMVLFFSVWPRLFGRRDLGRIQGTAQALTVIASAIGPLLLAWCVEWTGSYAGMFRLLAGIIACVAGAGLVVALPAPPSVPAVARSESS